MQCSRLRCILIVRFEPVKQVFISWHGESFLRTISTDSTQHECQFLGMEPIKISRRIHQLHIHTQQKKWTVLKLFQCPDEMVENSLGQMRMPREIECQPHWKWPNTKRTNMRWVVVAIASDFLLQFTRERKHGLQLAIAEVAFTFSVCFLYR